jgi:metalloprotease
MRSTYFIFVLHKNVKIMKRKSLLSAALFVLFGFSIANAQVNLGEKAMGALQKGVTGFTFSDEDAAGLSKEAVVKMDAENKVAGPKDAYWKAQQRKWIKIEL